MKILIILVLFALPSFAQVDPSPALSSEQRSSIVSAIIAGFGMIMNLGNDSTDKEIKTTKVQSPYIGKSYILKQPYFIQLNLPRGYRRNNSSVYVAQGEFVSFRNNCGNCLDSQRLEKPIRLHYLPIGSQIKVTDAFVIGNNFFKEDPDRTYLIIHDDKGHSAEITTLGFKVEVLMQEGSNFDYYVSLLNLIKEIERNQFVDQIVCAEKSRAVPSLIKSYPFKYSTQVERKIYRFIKDFDLKDQVEIFNFSFAHNSHDSISCAQMKFKSVNSISLFFYYAGDWGLSNNTYSLEQYTKIQNSPFTQINYKEFIQLSDNDIIKNYP